MGQRAGFDPGVAPLRVGSDGLRVAVVFPREWGRRGRMDVLVDDVRVGQLCPGTALLLPLQPGLHRLSVLLASPGRVTAERINGIPGAQAGFMVRVEGSRTFSLAMERLDPGATLRALGGVRLVRVAMPDT